MDARLSLFKCHHLSITLSHRSPVGLGQVGQVDVVVPHAPQAGQDLSKRCHDEVIAVPDNKQLIIPMN